MENRPIKYVGKITLNGKVDITDPCYDKDVWCRTTLNTIYPGEYECFVEYGEDPSFSIVSRASIVLSGDSDLASEVQERISDDKWRKVAEIGVDAGLAGFFTDKPDFNDEEWSELCHWMSDNDRMESDKKYAYLKCFDNGTNGFWTSSGHGDGCYEVYAICVKAMGQEYIAALEIRFL